MRAALVAVMIITQISFSAFAIEISREASPSEIMPPIIGTIPLMSSMPMDNDFRKELPEKTSPQLDNLNPLEAIQTQWS